MKKTVLKFGFIAGAIFAAMMFATMPFVDQIGFENGEIIGYTTLLVAFAFVFVGIRSYRENFGNGYITFGRAFKVGILITVIASLCYAISWLIVYYGFFPDFGVRYSQYLIEKLRAEGASPEQIAAQVAQMEKFWAIYKNPIYNFLITFFVEPFPIGLVITLISSAILRKRPKEVPSEAQLVSNP